jgi:hypothetical protein
MNSRLEKHNTSVYYWQRELERIQALAGQTRGDVSDDQGVAPENIPEWSPVC